MYFFFFFLKHDGDEIAGVVGPVRVAMKGTEMTWANW